jgi:hypothetical protein
MKQPVGESCESIGSGDQLECFQKFGESVYDSDSPENDAYRTQKLVSWDNSRLSNYQQGHQNDQYSEKSLGTVGHTTTLSVLGVNSSVLLY